ncbi:MAG TPA: glycosyltransferase family 1 protein [Saprospiraceae bacterium]|nr:glycosyltransferase family 1 protein [Saprospiraceae bacterium]
MLKVRLLTRDKRPGNYSIEGVFYQIVNALQSKVQFREYKVPSSKNRLMSILRANDGKSGINHITGDVHYLALSLPFDTTIITVHDVGHYEITLKGIKKKLYKILWLTWPLSNARYITCISEFTKNRLITILGIKSERISVIYNPVPENFIYSPREMNAKKPVILQVGTGNNKNRIGLINAAKGLSCHLIFIGELSGEHRRLLEDNKIEYTNPYHISQEEILNYYKICDILFFASFYEGFGLPIIEAQSVGRPVITSNCASMPEVAGDAAVFVDPHSYDDIREAIKSIALDTALNERLISGGLMNVKRFKTSDIAEQYYQLYETVNANLL